jgi:hypothetical protein
MVQGPTVQDKMKKIKEKKYVNKFLELNLNYSFKLIVLIFICQKFHSNQYGRNFLQPI